MPFDAPVVGIVTVTVGGWVLSGTAGVGEKGIVILKAHPEDKAAGAKALNAVFKDAFDVTGLTEGTYTRALAIDPEDAAAARLLAELDAGSAGKSSSPPPLP